ncbi:hypothetical protein CVT30_29480 [Streptomyces sp. AMCC400023]|nr:hypothetical protein CVT30_29480 [Streptomyces sp. AMCC400023]
MPPRRQPHITGTSSVPYRSTACRIGTHHACAESSPTVAPVDLPVIYEVCDCPCHAAPDQSTPAEVQR